MDLDCASLSLTRFWREEDLVLVRATDASRLCGQDGYEEIPAWRAGNPVENPDRLDLGDVREFVSQARLSSFPLSRVDDCDLIELVGDLVKSGDLVVLRKGKDAAGVPESTTMARRRLVREIDARTRGRLSYSGRQYKLVVDVDLSKTPDRNNHEVVQRADAAQILDAMAKQAGTQDDLAPLLTQARDKLSPDWRPPLFPDGLILLRRNISPKAVSYVTEPAITPSQLKRMLTKTEWIEIEVLDELGKPYPGPYRIELPDGSTAEGNFDEQGLWGDYDIDPGTCKLIVPDVPEAVKPAENPTTWISVTLVDAQGKAIVGRAYRLKLADGSERQGTTGDEEIRTEDIPAGNCTFSLSASE